MAFAPPSTSNGGSLLRPAERNQRAAASQAALDALLRDTPPPQGRWSDDEYLWLIDRCGRQVEFTDGRIEELPAPTDTHRSILRFLYRALFARLRPRGEVVMVSGLRLRLRAGKFREPDVVALRASRRRRRADSAGGEAVRNLRAPVLEVNSAPGAGAARRWRSNPIRTWICRIWSRMASSLPAGGSCGAERAGAASITRSRAADSYR